MMKRSSVVALILVVAVIGVWWLNNRSSSTSVSRSNEPPLSQNSQIPSSKSFASQEPRDPAQVSENFSEEVSSSAGNSGVQRAIPTERSNKRSLERTPAVTELQSSSLFLNSPWQRWVGMGAQLKQEGVSSVSDVSGFSIVESNEQWSEENFHEGYGLVYFNTRTQTTAVLTGIFRIILRDGAELGELAEVYDLKVTASFPHLHTYFVTSKVSPFNLVELKKRLQLDPVITESEPELLSRRYEKF